jgi:transmembrane protein EpsG
MFSELETAIFYSLMILGATFFGSVPGLIRIHKVLKYMLWSLSFIIAWIPAAIRFGIGTDYFSYIDKYYRITFYPQTFLEIINDREPAFTLLNFLVKWNVDNPQYVIAMSSFLLLIFIYMMINDQSKNINVGLAIFIFMTLFYFGSYNILRQYIAIGIVFYSYKYLIKKDFYKFLFLIIFAALFHITALIVLPIYLFTGQVRYKNIKLVVFIGIIIIIFYFYETFLASFISYEAFERYAVFTADAEREFGIGQIMLRLPILLPLLFYKKKIISFIKEYETLFYLIIIEPFLGVFAYISPNANRISLYYSIAYILLLSTFPRVFKRPYSYYASAYVVFYCITYWFIIYIYRGLHETIPYQSIYF